MFTVYLFTKKRPIKIMSVKFLQRAVFVPILSIAILSGCASQPSAPTRSAAEATQPTTADKPSYPYKSSKEFQKQAMRAQMEVMVGRDDFVEKALGIPRTAPNFKAIKESYGAWFADDLVTDMFIENAGAGKGQEGMVRQLTVKMFNGMNRLDDKQAMDLLGSMASMFSRMNPAQCKAYLDKSPNPTKEEKDGALAKLFKNMNDAEIRGLLGGFHSALHAELANAPMRPFPDKAAMKSAVSSIDAKIAGGMLGQGAEKNDCASFVQVHKALGEAKGEQHTNGLTFFLNMMGFAAVRDAK
jgi:hypothetical protein